LRRELEYWLSNNKYGKPTGSAGLIPYTKDPRGKTLILMILEKRPNTDTPVYNWLAGKRGFLSAGIPELPIQTALREAIEESEEFIRELIDPVKTLLQQKTVFWSLNAKMFLFPIKITWSPDLIERAAEKSS